MALLITILVSLLFAVANAAEVTAPKPGQSCMIGTVCPIEWEDFNGDDVVIVWLAADDPVNYVKYIAVKNEGLFDWQVGPDTPAGSYQIGLLDPSNDEFQGKSEVFEIIEGASSTLTSEVPSITSDITGPTTSGLTEESTTSTATTLDDILSSTTTSELETTSEPEPTYAPGVTSISTSSILVNTTLTTQTTTSPSQSTTIITDRNTSGSSRLLQTPTEFLACIFLGALGFMASEMVHV